MLNRALWWFMVALLVTCALADQNSESLLMGPKYAIDRDDRCWGFLENGCAYPGERPEYLHWMKYWSKKHWNQNLHVTLYIVMCEKECI